jgi:hypothetical protein
MSRAGLEECVMRITAIDDDALRQRISEAVADVVADLLTAAPVARAARGEVLVHALRHTATEAAAAVAEDRLAGGRADG